MTDSEMRKSPHSQHTTLFAEHNTDCRGFRLGGRGGGGVPSKDLDPQLEFPILAEYLAQFQDPAKACKVFAIKQELDSTKEVLYKTIDKVLERGENIESLMEKSDDLSASSMKFYQTSKKTRCCTIL